MKKFYETPEMEIVEVATEQFFAASVADEVSRETDDGWAN